MSWVKKENLLPGNNRPIQIWGLGINGNDEDGRRVYQNIKGYYYPEINKFINSVNDKSIEGVTHWAEMLSKPED